MLAKLSMLYLFMAKIWMSLLNLFNDSLPSKASSWLTRFSNPSPSIPYRPSSVSSKENGSFSIRGILPKHMLSRRIIGHASYVLGIATNLLCRILLSSCDLPVKPLSSIFLSCSARTSFCILLKSGPVPWTIILNFVFFFCFWHFRQISYMF